MEHPETLLFSTPSELGALARNAKEDIDLKKHISNLELQKKYARRIHEVGIQVMANKFNRAKEKLRRCKTSYSIEKGLTVELTRRRCVSMSAVESGNTPRTISSSLAVRRPNKSPSPRAAFVCPCNDCDGTSGGAKPEDSELKYKPKVRGNTMSYLSRPKSHAGKEFRSNIQNGEVEMRRLSLNVKETSAIRAVKDRYTMKFGRNFGRSSPQKGQGLIEEDCKADENNNTCSLDKNRALKSGEKSPRQISKSPERSSKQPEKSPRSKQTESLNRRKISFSDMTKLVKRHSELKTSIKNNTIPKPSLSKSMPSTESSRLQFQQACDDSSYEADLDDDNSDSLESLIIAGDEHDKDESSKEQLQPRKRANTSNNSTPLRSNWGKLIIAGGEDDKDEFSKERLQPRKRANTSYNSTPLRSNQGKTIIAGGEDDKGKSSKERPQPRRRTKTSDNLTPLTGNRGKLNRSKSLGNFEPPKLAESVDPLPNKSSVIAEYISKNSPHDVRKFEWIEEKDMKSTSVQQNNKTKSRRESTSGEKFLADEVKSFERSTSVSDNNKTSPGAENTTKENKTVVKESSEVSRKVRPKTAVCMTSEMWNQIDVYNKGRENSNEATTEGAFDNASQRNDSRRLKFDFPKRKTLADLFEEVKYCRYLRRPKYVEEQCFREADFFEYTQLIRRSSLLKKNSFERYNENNENKMKDTI